MYSQTAFTVNPSLRRQAKLNMNQGLYQVKNNIYQVRGYDLSNMDVIEGKQGIIIIDPFYKNGRACTAKWMIHKRLIESNKETNVKWCILPNGSPSDNFLKKE